MRVTALVFAASLLTLVADRADAQRSRVPRLGRRPPSAAPLPPRAPGLSDPRLYVSSRFTFETYPMVSWLQASGAPSTTQSTGGFASGGGSRLEFRLNPVVSLAGDVTTALLGGPMAMHTMEVGTRLQAPRANGGARPYLDLRVSYAYAEATYGEPWDINTTGSPGGSFNTLNQVTSRGPGALAGVGWETPITPTLSLATGLAVARHRLTGRTMTNGLPSASWEQPSTSMRFTFGLQYNPRYARQR